jgi:hypothetical protein
MTLWTAVHGFATEHSFMARLVGFGILGGVMLVLFRTLFSTRKIEPKGFKWKTLRNEVIFALAFGSVTGYFIGFLTSTLNHFGLIEFKTGPASWWVIALEYALYFFTFDTWFYWMHRLMHKEPMVNGGFVSLFTAVVTVHHSTTAPIVPTSRLRIKSRMHCVIGAHDRGKVGRFTDRPDCCLRQKMGKSRSNTTVSHWPTAHRWADDQCQASQNLFGR